MMLPITLNVENLLCFFYIVFFFFEMIINDMKCTRLTTSDTEVPLICSGKNRTKRVNYLKVSAQIPKSRALYLVLALISSMPFLQTLDFSIP